MSEKTNIQWTTHTFSPWIGCRKVSVCYDNCYITETPALRFRGLKHGPDRIRTSVSYWKQAEKWNSQAANLPGRPRVFPSLCDPFDTEVDQKWFNDFMSLIVRTPNLDWLLLTKRIGSVVERLSAGPLALPANVWLGVSVGNQADADRWIDPLIKIDAKVRFLSVEPMLEQIDLGFIEEGAESDQEESWAKPTERGCLINWVIFGGESGRGARPCNLGWIRDGVAQCKSVNVAAFVKQIGRNPVWDERDMADRWYEQFSDSKGGNMEEWPFDVRLREMP